MKIYRIIRDERGILKIELGKHWEIEFTREFQESTAYLRKGGSNLDYIKGHKAFTRVVKEGGYIPRWYGFAYHDFDRDVKVFIPIPFNMIIVGLRWIKFNILRNIQIEWPCWLWAHERRIYFLGKKVGYEFGKYSREAIEDAHTILRGTNDVNAR